MRVSVDTSLCQAYGNCLLAAPEVFDLDEESNLAVVLVTEPGEEKRKVVEEAVRACPALAVVVEG